MKNQTKNLCFAAVMAALIYVFTTYIHIPMPSHGGYTHVGDAFVYLSGALLATPYGMAAGAVGAALADLLTGFGIWAPASVIIKALTAFCFTAKAEKILCRRNLLAIIPAFVLCVGGYYLYDAVVISNFVAAAAGIPGYCVQVVASTICYLAFGALLDRSKFKDRIAGGAEV